MDEKRQFERGDIITKSSVKGWFVIYDGTPINVTTYTKKYALVLYYDPEKYQKVDDSGTWDKREFLSYATCTEACAENIDENKETFWYTIAEGEDLEAVHKKLAEMHLHWDRDTLTLTNTETGEVIKQLKSPKLNYDGLPIIPSNGFLRSICATIDKVNPKETAGSGAYHNPYYGRYGEDYYDY